MSMAIGYSVTNILLGLPELNIELLRKSMAISATVLFEVFAKY